VKSLEAEKRGKKISLHKAQLYSMSFLQY